MTMPMKTMAPKKENTSIGGAMKYNGTVTATDPIRFQNRKHQEAA